MHFHIVSQFNEVPKKCRQHCAYLPKIDIYYRCEYCENIDLPKNDKFFVEFFILKINFHFLSRYTDFESQFITIMFPR